MEEINFEGYVSAKEFGEMLNPPRTARAVCFLCNHGKVQGAKKVSILGGKGNWLIPKTALGVFDVEYRHRRTKKELEEARAKESALEEC